MNAAMESQPYPNVTGPRVSYGLVGWLVSACALVLLAPLASAQPTPRLYSASPSVAMASDAVVLRGKYLDTVTEARLGEVVLPITEASSSRLTVTLPANATTGTVSVTGPGGIATLRRTLEVFALPELTRVEPTEVFAGDTITLHGKHFEDRHASYRFGRYSARVRKRASDQVDLRLPGTTREGQLSVRVHGKSKDLGKPIAPHVVPRVSGARTLVGAPGSLTVSGRYLDTVERFTLGEQALAVASGDDDRGRRRVLTLPAMAPGKYTLNAYSHGRTFAYRRTITVEYAPQIEAIRYQVEGRSLRVFATGKGLKRSSRVNLGRAVGRIRSRSDDRLVFTVRSAPPTEPTMLSVRTSLGTSPDFPLQANTAGYGTDVVNAAKRLAKADKTYALAQIRLDAEQLTAVLNETDPKASKAAAIALDRGGPPAVRERALSAAQGIVRIGAMQQALCVQMKAGKPAAPGNAALGTMLAQVSAQEVDVLKQTLTPLLRDVPALQLLSNPAAFGLVEVDRELTLAIKAQAKLAATCKDRYYGTDVVGLAAQTAQVELKQRVRDFFADVLGRALDGEAMERRRASLRRVLDAFDAPRRPTLETDLTPHVTRVQEDTASVTGKGVIVHKQATEVTPQKGKAAATGETK